MAGEAPRPLWREPGLVAVCVVLVIAVGAIGIIAVDELAEPVLLAPVDGDGVPTALPDGKALPAVPPRLSAAFDRPVVLVGTATAPQDNLERCGGQGDWAFAPTLRAALVTPEGLTVAIRGEERGTEALIHVTCHALWGGRRWETWASWVGEAADPEEPLGPPEPVCCRDDGLALGSGEVDAPEGAAWMVQDRGPYWLAYPVEGGLVHPVWPVSDGDGPPPPTVWLDAAGRRLADEAAPPPDPEGPAEGESGAAPPEGGPDGEPPGAGADAVES